MKKQYAIIVPVVLSLISLFSSCDNKMRNKTGAFQFDSIRINETEHLFGDTAKPGANLIIRFVYPVSSSSERMKDSLISLIIAPCFEEEYTGENVNATVRRYAENYFNGYRKDLEPMYVEDEKDPENKDVIQSWYSYYKTIETDVQFYEGDLLVYRMEYREFTGGAHETYRSNFLNLDLETMQPLTLDDIFTDGHNEEITEMLWAKLMVNTKVGSREELENMGYGLSGDLAPVENFYLDKGGITFHYNIYEFTPYVMGDVEIKLPFGEISHLLRDNRIINQLRK